MMPCRKHGQILCWSNTCFFIADQYIASTSAKYPLFKQDIELLEEKLRHIIVNNEEVEEDEAPPCDCTDTAIIAVIIVAVVLLVLVCVGLGLAVADGSAAWAIVAVGTARAQWTLHCVIQLNHIVACAYV